MPDEKLRILGLIPEYLRLFQDCARRFLEAPWKAAVSHVIQLVGRDLLNSNVDIRTLLTCPSGQDLARTSEKDKEKCKGPLNAQILERIRIFQFCCLELARRLIEGLAYF